MAPPVKKAENFRCLASKEAASGRRRGPREWRVSLARAAVRATGCILLICLSQRGQFARSSHPLLAPKNSPFRAALGGDRLQLLLERGTESFLLSLTGGAIGLFLAWTALRWLIHIVTTSLASKRCTSIPQSLCSPSRPSFSVRFSPVSFGARCQ